MNDLNLPRLKALIIEDDRGLTMLAKQSLLDHRQVSFDIRTAASLKDGWEAHRQFHPHLTLLDITLPDGNGLDLIPHLLREHPNGYIVMMTGSAEFNDVRRAKELGAMDYILKPFTLGKVNEMVRGCLEQIERKPAGPLTVAGLELRPHDEASELPFCDITNGLESRGGENSAINEMIRGWNVLFIDELYANVENAQHHLRRTGCQIEVAYSVGEAWDKIHARDFNVVFVGTHLTGEDGYGFSQRLRNRERERNVTPRSFIVGLMEQAGEKDERRWLQSGMNDFIVKPCRFGDLERKLRKLASQRLEAAAPQGASARAQ